MFRKKKSKDNSSIYNNHSTKEVSSEKVFKITTAKVVMLILFVVAIIGFMGISATKGRIEEVDSGMHEEKGSYEFVYSSGTVFDEFKNMVLIYDGHNLRYITETGYEKVNVSLTAENFSLSKNDNYVYIADISSRSVFVVDENGSISSQVNVEYLPKRIVAMPDNRFVVHFVDGNLTEGIAIYSKDGSLLGQYVYPKVTITVIKPSLHNGVVVAGLYRDASKLTNLIYEYGVNGDLKYSGQIDNILIMNMDIQNDYYIWQDINQIYVTDGDYKSVAKIDSMNAYECIEVTSNITYTIDEKNGISTIDSSFNTTKDSRFTDDLIGVCVYKDKPLYYSKDKIVYGDNSKEYTQEIIDVIPLKNSYIVVSKGKLRFER